MKCVSIGLAGDRSVNIVYSLRDFEPRRQQIETDEEQIKHHKKKKYKYEDAEPLN